MTIEKQQVDAPTVAASTGSIVCSQCEHEPHASVSTPSKLREFLGMRPAPVRCTVLEHDSSGWAAHPCQCADPIHS